MVQDIECIDRENVDKHVRHISSKSKNDTKIDLFALVALLFAKLPLFYIHSVELWKFMWL